jgi:hypothetical protein
MMADMGKNAPKPKKAKAPKEKATSGDKDSKAQLSGFEIEELRAIKADAFIGFRVMKMDPPPDGAYWGKFNDRVVEEKWVNALATDFERDLDNCAEDTTMEIVVYRKWLAELEEGEVEVNVLEGKRLNQVPALRLTPSGQKEASDENLWVMGGNHRRLALGKFLEKMRAELEKDEADLEKVTEANKKAMDPEGEGENEENKLKKEVSRKREVINKAQKWVVKVYDRGAQG